MTIHRVSCLLFSSLILYGCRYTFTEDVDIEKEMLKVTPIGISSTEAKTQIEKRFGKDAYIGGGIAIETNGIWSTGGWYTDADTRDFKEPYYYVYKLDSHLYVVLPRYVYGTWYFDETDTLKKIEIHKEIDGL
jgi:hypothetical protein